MKCQTVLTVQVKSSFAYGRRGRDVLYLPRSIGGIVAVNL